MNFSIPEVNLLGFEHPFEVANTLNAINTLGGSYHLKELVDESRGHTRATLYLKPEDEFTAPIISEKLKTSDVLMKVTVPKLIRVRKGRRQFGEEGDGSHDSLSLDEKHKLHAHGSKRLLRALKEAPSRCDFEMVGRIDRTHRFRGLPDFVVGMTPGPIFQEFTKAIEGGDYALIPQFDHDYVAKSTLSELFPTPRVSAIQLQHNYRFEPNRVAKKLVDESGNIDVGQETTTSKIYTPRLRSDVENIPTRPPPETTRVEDLEPSIQAMVRALEQAFEERPIWTRRALENHINRPEWRTVYKYGYQYVSYMFRSGPWRDAAVKLGVDPRTDPKYRIYQTMFFQLDKSLQTNNTVDGHRGRALKEPSTAQAPASPNTSHIFDGISVAFDGRVWQVCDITEPMVSGILATASLRRTCELQNDGWFHNGTIAKAHVLMKTIMQYLTGESSLPNQTAITRVLELPEILDEDARPVKVARKDARLYGELVSAVRGMARAPERTVLPQADVDSMDMTLEEFEYDEDMPIDPRLMRIMGEGGVVDTETGDSSDNEFEMIEPEDLDQGDHEKSNESGTDGEEDDDEKDDDDKEDDDEEEEEEEGNTVEVDGETIEEEDGESDRSYDD